MVDPIPCPDCGHPNPPESTSCERCNFPLVAQEPPAGPDEAPAPRPLPASSPTGTGPPESAPPSEPAIFLRPPKRRERAQTQSVAIWLMFGVVAAAAVLYTAIKANVDRMTQPVEGSSQEQQERANALQAALAKDSTDVEAHIGLANVLYDTGNWSQAIVHYRAAINRDSSRAPVLVDLGVSYFNLGDTRHAEELFLQALRRDPHQPVALFNLGIVAEHRKDWKSALQYYHRAMQSSPPETMTQPLIEAMQRVQQQTGAQAPPLSEGNPPAGR